MTLFRDNTLARLAVCALMGVGAGVGLAVGGQPDIAPLAGWAVTGGLFVLWTLLVIWPMDGDDTRAHSQREDPSHGFSHGILLLASLVSIAGIVVMLFGTREDEDAQSLLVGLVAMGAVAVSWLMIHTLYTLRYAKAWYRHEGEKIIDFNEDDDYEPRYSDFAYVAFDMGTTYQISDTSVRTPRLRQHVMLHGLLSYLFGTVILATAINLVVSLAG